MMGGSFQSLLLTIFAGIHSILWNIACRHFPLYSCHRDDENTDPKKVSCRAIVCRGAYRTSTLPVFHCSLLSACISPARQQQRDPEKMIKDLAPAMPMENWPASALDLFRGRMGMDEFLRSYWHPNGAKKLRRKAQAMFFAGQQYLYLGQTNKAGDSFRKCVQLGIRDLNEFRMARLRLAELKPEKPKGR